MSEGMASSPMRCSAYMKLLWKLTCHLTGLLLRRIMIPRRYVASTGERVPQVRLPVVQGDRRMMLCSPATMPPLRDVRAALPFVAVRPQAHGHSMTEAIEILRWLDPNDCGPSRRSDPSKMKHRKT